MIEYSERESLFERQHSFKWYFDELTKKYEKAIKWQRRQAIDNLPIRKDSPRLFELCRDSEGTISGPQVDFALFVDRTEEVEEQISSPESMVREFELQKLLVWRRISTIDHLFEKICEYNVDRGIFEVDDKIVNLKNVLYWLYIDSVKEPSGNVLFKDRTNEFIRSVAEQYWLRKISYDFGNEEEAPLALKSVDEKQAFEHTLLHSFKERWNDKGKIKDVSKSIELCVKEIINQTFDTYKMLKGFLKYAIPHNMINQSGDTGMDRKGINKVVAMSKAVDTVMLSMFISYLKLNGLNLPRAEFANARMMHVNCANSNFVNSDFPNADLRYANLANCDFSNNNFAFCDATSADFTGSTLSYSNIVGVKFTNAILNGVKIDSVKTLQYSAEEIIKKATSAGNNEDELKIFRQNLNNAVGIDQDQGLHEFRKVIIDGIGKNYKESGFADMFAFSDDSVKISPTMNNFISDVVKSGTTAQNKYAIYPQFISKLKSIYPSAPICAAAMGIVEGAEESKGISLNMVGASMKKASAPGLDLSVADISEASICDTNLSSALFANTKAKRADFRESSLSNVKAYNADFEFASFIAANCTGSVLLGCNLNYTNFSNVLMLNSIILNDKQTSFIEDITKSRVEKKSANDESDSSRVEKKPSNEESSSSRLDANLEKLLEHITEEMPVNENDMIDSIWDNANANNIFISGLRISKSRFRNADFKGAIFINCDAASTTWDNADLTFSVHMGVSFRQSTFEETNMSRTRIHGCEFSSCGMRSLNIASSTVKKAVFKDANLNDASFANATFDNCVFDSCAFSGVVVSNAVFTNCIFIDLDFANIRGIHSATFKKCIFSLCKNENGPITNDNKYLDLRGTPSPLKLQAEEVTDASTLLRYSTI